VKSKLIVKKVDLDNCCISYYEGGITSNLEPILFIHGWGVLVEPYQESLNILSERYQVIAPVLPGLGNSTAPEKIQNSNDYAKIIGNFVKKLNLKKVHVVGHSLGGAIAIALAALMPSIVRSLIIVDSTGIPLGSIPEVVLKRAIEMPAQSWQMKIQPVSAIFKSLLYNSLFHLKNTIKMGFIALEEDIRPILPKIESPCLILWGENDVLTPVKFAQELSQGIRGSKLKIVEQGYHEWNLFFPDKFTEIIFDFIAEVEKINLARV
jgi:pimeloyl-ACP methyl ester carboxylesterase